MTGVGALPVLVLRKVSPGAQNAMLGFGAGVMLAATAFSLVLPGMVAGTRHFGSTGLAALVVACGILAGGLFLWLTNHYFGHDEIGKGPYDVAAQNTQRAWLLDRKSVVSGKGGSGRVDL